MSDEEILPLIGRAKKKPGRPRKKPELLIKQPRPRGRPPKLESMKPQNKQASRAYIRPDTIILKYSDGREARTTNLDVDAWLPVFIKHLSLWGNVTAAAEYVGISRKTARKAYNERPDVREQWHDAIEEAAERLEMDVSERARKSDLLAMFLLKGLKPEKYREKYEAPASQVANDFIVEIGNEPVRQLAEFQPSTFVETDRIDSATTRILPE
jgi:hypothetical protein